MLNRIKEVFAERKQCLLGEYNKNAVAILLYEENNETYIIFEMRSKSLKHQPGDICLPGGRIEKDENPLECAMRETIEELNVKREDIEYIGTMDTFISPYASIIYSFVFKSKTKYFKPNDAEVDHTFMVPLNFFLNNEPEIFNFEIAPIVPEDFPYDLIAGGRDYKFNRGKQHQYFYKYQEYVIWGYTALIIKSFANILKETASI